MKERYFKHVETDEVTCASKEGYDSYKRLFDEEKREGYIDTSVSFKKPPKKDLIEQGLLILENDDDYIEISKEDAKK